MYDVRSERIHGYWFNFLQRKDTLQGFVNKG